MIERTSSSTWVRGVVEMFAAEGVDTTALLREAGIGAAEAQSKFGFLLDAFRFGAPPHAGFAFGIDRLVALLVGEENIREVIAFPKTQSGSDPLTQAPTDIDPAQLAELGLRLLPRSAD